MKKIIFLGGAVIFAASCSPKNVPVSEGKLSKSQRIAHGKELYEARCNRCHKLPDPASFTSVQWVGILNSMAPKAKMTEDQHEMTYEYVASVSKK